MRDEFFLEFFSPEKKEKKAHLRAVRAPGAAVSPEEGTGPSPGKGEKNHAAAAGFSAAETCGFPRSPAACGAAAAMAAAAAAGAAPGAASKRSLLLLLLALRLHLPRARHRRQKKMTAEKEEQAEEERQSRTLPWASPEPSLRPFRLGRQRQLHRLRQHRRHQRRPLPACQKRPPRATGTSSAIRAYLESPAACCPRIS